MTDLCTPPGAVRDATPLPHRRLHRAVFLAADFYNLGWGLYAVVDPQWLFRFAQLPLQNHPEVFASLGMVIGLYGILYLEVARHPEQHWPLAAVGMAGKVLGPLGFAHLLLSGQWPLRAGIIVLTNDLLWWLPFALYLHDARTARRPSARPAICHNPAIRGCASRRSRTAAGAALPAVAGPGAADQSATDDGGVG